MTQASDTQAAPHQRLTYSQIIERLTERRGGGGGSITIKLSAQGVVMPEVTVQTGATDDEVATATAQAITAFQRILTECEPPTKGGGEK